MLVSSGLTFLPASERSLKAISLDWCSRRQQPSGTMRAITILILLAGSVGCTRDHAQHDTVDTALVFITHARDTTHGAAAHAPTSPWTPDTFTLTVTKPVVIANAAVTQSDVDADLNGLVEVISDFDTYLGAIQDSLRRLGVDFQSTNTLVIRLRIDSIASTWNFPRGSVGYLFAAPHRPPRQIMGVYTADDIISSLRTYVRGYD
jgi:hypothetical protein